MKTNKFLTAATILAVAFLFPSSRLLAGAVPKGFTAHDAEVNGVRLHYLIGGKGDPVVLLHGYAQTNMQGKIISGSGHWLMDEAPQTVIPALIAFINEPVATASASGKFPPGGERIKIIV